MDPIRLMMKFSDDTGLTSSKPPRRYLWTDSFAVCNFLGLFQITGEKEFQNLAFQLVDQVHETLGKHREDDDRSGWLGSKNHPTMNGLRIGKPLPERKPNDPFDPNLEWERDGQYFHYLTKWMHALYRVYQVVQAEKYLTWAIDLAQASTRFINNNRMYWKMNIALTDPLVPSMGQHDPIDGYITFKVLETVSDVDLGVALKKLERMIQQGSFVTNDPLGIGGLLFDAYRLAQMSIDSEKKERLITAALIGLEYFRLSHGLAFRELGLAIGLQATKKMRVIEEHWPLIDKINNYWLKHSTWTEHTDINQVMLATSLAPEGFLSL